MPKIPVCLICGKDLPFITFGSGEIPPLCGEKYDQIDGGGNVEISFHYGSSFDLCLGAPWHPTPVKAYICDGCFDTVKDRTNYEEIPKADPNSCIVIDEILPLDEENL